MRGKRNMKKKINAIGKDDKNNTVGMISFGNLKDEIEDFVDKVHIDQISKLMELSITLENNEQITFAKVRKIEINNVCIIHNQGGIQINFNKNQPLKDIEEKLRKNKI